MQNYTSSESNVKKSVPLNTSIETKVLHINMQEAEAIQNSDNQFVIRGRHHAKTKRSKFIGKTFNMPESQLEEIKQKLKTSKRKFFELNVNKTIGLSQEEKEEKIKQMAQGKKFRGRKPNLNKKPTVQNQSYLATIDENGGAKILAILDK